jgi:uncharacterized protein
LAVMKTPGVYIVEKNAFPSSVVEVATAVPAFVGYTEKAEDHGKSLAGRPWRISSMAEYHTYFGSAPQAVFDLAAVRAGDGEVAVLVGPARKGYRLKQSAGRFDLYRGMQLFFANGGGPCWIVSVGEYGAVRDDPRNAAAVDRAALERGIVALEREQEPALLVVPDAVLLADEGDCIGVQQAMLSHCGAKMGNRFAILDVYAGHRPLEDRPVADFRDHIGPNHRDFGAAYYPFLHASVVTDEAVTYEAITPSAALVELLKEDLGLTQEPGAGDAKAQALWQAVNALARSADDWHRAYARANASPTAAVGAEPGDAAAAAWIADEKKRLENVLINASLGFKTLRDEIRRQLNLLPPSPAMAGIYCMVDNVRGVWKAPANVGIDAVVAPAVSLSSADQEHLNVDPKGKSINAIRAFVGEGTLVWGARTLDGNSLDWRYINVRRTIIMLEQSCRLAARALVFEPNAGGTWITIKSMIANFLTGIWKRGGLAGAVPEDAFSVHVGLGESMTAEDILEGILRVTVLVAMSRPAEFIEITFQQQMRNA